MKLNHRLRHVLAAMAILAGGIAPALDARAASADEPRFARDNLMVVVREVDGANKPDEALVPGGKGTVTRDDGSRVELNLAWWNFIGDLHVRFVFDQPDTLMDAMPEDLERLKVSNVDQALALALENIHRVYGPPTTSVWAGAVMAVSGRSPDLDSAYMLDRDFWRAQLKAHPEGLVVALPSRSDLLFVPLGETGTVEKLRKNIAALRDASENHGVSSALFLFKDDKWSVFQAPAKR